MIKLNKIKRNCVAAVILTMCLMTAGCARNSTSTTTASGGETTITSGITKEDTDVTHADDEDEVTIVLNGTSGTCSTGSPIYVKNASKVKIKSEENSFTVT